MGKIVNVAVLCQNDNFVLPANIRRLSRLKKIKLVAVVNIDHKGSLVNKKMLFLRGFGIFQVARLALVALAYKFADLVDGLFSYKLGFCRSLQSVAVMSGAAYKSVKNPNSKEFLKWMKDENVELIVSFSAPCIFGKDLLELPTFGCINLHCSLLPKFAGLLPSFWVLFEGEKTIGATVHMMDTKIDNGEILGQVEIEMPTPLTMFSVINATKAAGGVLMVSTVENIVEDEVNMTVNTIPPNGYYSWPTVDQIKSFRHDGGRLI
jgi:methionyl-tRNA formyltransferase